MTTVIYYTSAGKNTTKNIRIRETFVLINVFQGDYLLHIILLCLLLFRVCSRLTFLPLILNSSNIPYVALFISLQNNHVVKKVVKDKNLLN